MDWSVFSALLGGMGVGSLLTTCVQIFFQRKKEKEGRAFEEKKLAYLEYIKVIQESQFMRNPKEAAWKRTAAMARIELFGGKEVLKEMEMISQIHEGDLAVPLKNLLSAMRSDLNVNDN